MAAPLCGSRGQPRLLLQLLKRAQSSRGVAGPVVCRRGYHATPAASSPAIGDGQGRFLFLGAPGVGKGTFASIVAPQMGLRVVSAGDLIRAALKAPPGSEGGGVVLTEEHHELLRKGGLLPDGVVEALVKHALLPHGGQAQSEERTHGFILDGYPRTVHQAGVLESWLRRVGMDLHGAVSIELEEWVAVAKVMARHACSLCGKSFNSAHIVIDGYDMPAMLPPAPGLCGGKDDKPCPVHERGGYDTREDDRDEAVVKRRYEVYRQQTAPLMGFYEQRGLLHRFTVKRGIKDAPTLMQAMLQRQTGKKKQH